MKNLFPTDRYTAVYYNKQDKKPYRVRADFVKLKKNGQVKVYTLDNTGGLYASDKKKNFLGFEKDGEICDWSHAEKQFEKHKDKKSTGR